MLRKSLPLYIIGLIITSISCGGGESESEGSTDSTEVVDMYFEKRTPTETGIEFRNDIQESDTMNYLSFQYMYNGGGVGVGDINNDGLADLYFTGNQVADRLYLNKGDLKFEDITESSGIMPHATGGWHTGVTMADVNQDGFLDIYVCRSGHENWGDQLTNLLFINQGNSTFKEESEAYGVNVGRGSNQAAFFDMDNDGDLDLYVMNKRYPDDKALEEIKDWPNSDILLENVDGKFKDISKSAGIQNSAYGLGLAIADLNNDGYQDIYVSNDYIQADFMYINQGNKTFKDEIHSRTNHTSHFGMGNDIADFDNDGYVDIMTADMANEDHYKSKTNMAGMNPYDFWNSIDKGNHYEYMFNTLQLNNGNGTYSEMAQIAGVSKTDWSWAPLLADFDNDGLKDLFVTNGFRRDVRSNDYIPYFNANKDRIEDWEEILGEAPTSVEVNYMFKNVGDLHFRKVMTDWKMDEAINSNGASYADLDNDGDLDLIINNMDEYSFILENKLSAERNYLKFTCDEFYDGLRITLYAGDQTFYNEFHATRGYQSSVDHVVHFGLGNVDKIDEVRIEFFDGKGVILKDVSTNQLVSIKYADATDIPDKLDKSHPFFEEVAKLDHQHMEFYRNDFEREVLLPHRMSQLGPFMSSGDVDGDGLEDLFVSGSKKYTSTLYRQLENGSFRKMSGPWEKEFEREDLDSKFFDADGDGDLDLYVCSGSNEYTVMSGNPQFDEYAEYLQDQLYINNGNWQFTNETASRLPRMITSGQRVTVGDYDGDGDEDLFVGGRQVPGFYPMAPSSYLLQNNDGIFSDVTVKSPALKEPGMITQSIFDDFDGDKDLDLICVGEWMPITFFENDKGVFKNVTKHYGLDKTVGWWMSIEKGDFNGDGKNDYALGNIGENNKFHPSDEKPLEIYLDDFDQNGTNDIVLGKYQDGRCLPVRGRQCSSEQMPFIQDKFPTYDEFARADLGEIYGDTKLSNSLHYTATNFSSSVLLSSGDKFELEHMPIYAQLGPINGMIAMDVNHDGHLDIVGVGNNFGAEVETIRYDGSRGVVLLGDGEGNFKSLAPYESGFFVNLDAKDLLKVDNLIFVSSNGANIKTIRHIGG